MAKRPFYRRYPANFLSGTHALTMEQKGCYNTMLDLMYDGWKPLKPDHGSIARQCGCSTRKFTQTVAELIAIGKIKTRPDGRYSNDRFEEEAKSLGVDLDSPDLENISDLSPKYPVDKSEIIGGIIEGINQEKLNGNNETPPKTGGADSRARAYQTPDSRFQTSLNAPSVQEQAEAVEHAILKVCDALGVALSGAGVPVWRSAWVMQLQILMAEDELDLDLDIIPVLRAAKARPKFNPESVRSLRMFRPDFAAARKARAMHAHLVARADDRQQAHVPSFTDTEWYNYLVAFVKAGAWVRGDCGPSPCEPGCLVPKHLLLRARAYWEQHGNHPEVIIFGNSFLPWKPDANGLFPEAKPFAPIIEDEPIP